MGSSTAHAFQAKRIRPAVFSLSQSGRLWPFSLHSSVSLFFALLGAHATLTDLPDRLRLLKKNVDTNVRSSSILGSAVVSELTWGEDPDAELLEPLPDYVLGSDVIYSEGAVGDLLLTLQQLCGNHTTIILAGELRNDAVLEYFLEAAMEDFLIGCVDQTELHPEFCSHRVAVYVLAKKTSREPSF
uniref:Calmodulin-lysine N-methyltransferase n=1 Tax=Opuntia streptacantha TaxID=393608 RepID=A0A7C9B030_OPUST